jgi:hypothetical protein
MAKRFSVLELGLLMAPVLLIGALGLWSSRRPAPPAPNEKLRLDFRIETPTAIEAFRGANVAFVTEIKGHDAKKHSIQQHSPFLELQTLRGTEISRWGTALS